MKLLGGILIILGCLGCAFRYMDKLHTRIELLKEWRTILEAMEGEIRYGRLSFPECFIRMGGHFPTPLGQCLGEIGRVMEENPHKNFREETEKKLQGVLGNDFSQQEKKDLFCIWIFQGCRDEQMQQKLLQRCRENVEEYLSKWKGEYRGKSKVALSLGAMMGIVLVLLLI